ncbi:hypothetical protein [Branchiibius cervicis]|uniref:Uncharacterized protein n=1 Tax=Branchiibius cervicis TaxID=908252 RepID=A0ABW2AWV7_9MICO
MNAVDGGGVVEVVAVGFGVAELDGVVVVFDVVGAGVLVVVVLGVDVVVDVADEGWTPTSWRR